MRLWRWVQTVNANWRADGVGKTSLAKYIVLFASILHIIWAGLLFASPDTTGPTPVHVLVAVFGGRYRAAIALAVIAVVAVLVPFQRRRVSNRALAGMLIPQQVVLLMSAGAGIYATLVRHYADGVLRPWPFILADQLPVILAALLYTFAVLEAAGAE